METNTTSLTPENTTENVVQPPESTPGEQQTLPEPTEEQRRVVPELAFRQLLPPFMGHLAKLTRNQARNTLAHALAYPFEHDQLPPLAGAHSKQAFQISIRLFDAKLLMMYSYMRQAETSSLETIDQEIKNLQEKREQLVKEQETKENK